VGGYVTVSTRVRREVVEKARELGINISQFLRERLEEEVRKREVEALRRRLEGLDDVLKRINTEEVVRLIREDRERR
jgi:post-segregation antitoxin (ccd killing protein)